MSCNYDLSVKHLTNKENSVNVSVSLCCKGVIGGEIFNLNVHVDKVSGADLSYYESTAINKAGELLKDIASEI